MLQSKLLVPRAQRIFPRPRLFSRLELITKKRLTLVVAGAGYGKTTLIAQKLRQSGIKSVWYTLDEADIDFCVFVKYCFNGFQKYFCDRNCISGIIQSGAPISKKKRHQILECLINAVENAVKDDLIFVLDDFHLVQSSPEICESIEFILNHLPMSMHMVIISRSEPDFAMSRLRVMREVVEIRQEDIKFHRSEIEGLYSHVFNLSLTREHLSQLHEKTDGWVAILILFHITVKDRKNEEIEKALGQLKGTGRLIFQYLEENIFNALSAEMKTFLMKTSLLEALEPEFCDEYLSIKHSADLLGELRDSHLLTFQYRDGIFFYYHHLFKDFLQNKLLQFFDDKTLGKLYLDIAGLLEKKGDDTGAIKYYLKGKHYLLAATRIFVLEEKLFNSGRINLMGGFLSQLPEVIIESTPGLQYVKARLCSFSGEPHSAIVFFNNALNGFQKESSLENIRKCRMQLGFNYYYTGDIKKAEFHLEKLFADGVENKDLQTAGLLILISSILGKIHAADAYAEIAGKEVEKIEAPHRLTIQRWIDFTYSYRYYVSGHFKRAYHISIDVLGQYLDSDLEILLPLAYLHVALPAYFLKKYGEGYECARKGLELLEKMDVHDNQAGWLYYAMALNLNGLNRNSGALEHIEKSLAIFTKHTNYWGQANAYDLLHFIYLKTGRINKALHHLKKGFEILKKTDLPLTWGILEIGLLTVKLLKKEFDVVPEFLSSSLEKVRNSAFYTLKNILLTSKYKLFSGDKKQALKALEEALVLAEEYGYEAHIADDEEAWIVPLLMELYSKEFKRGAIQKVFNLKGKNAQSLLFSYRKGKELRLVEASSRILENMPAWSTPALKISLLGKFRIFIGDRELAERKFKKNLKAMMIIKYLAFKYGRGFTHRDELIELVWPEQDFKRTTKRFNVAVSFIRKLFEPDIRRGFPSSYLAKQSVSFKLDLGDRGMVDIHCFLDEIERGYRIEKTDPGQAIKCFLKAETLYTGPFLIEDTYTQWCHEQRERFQDKYLFILTKIIAYYHGEKDFLRGIVYADKYLGIDRGAEKIYRKLMQFHSMAGNLSQLKQTYDACSVNVMETLDCPLEQRTIDLYHHLLSHH